MSAAQCAEEQSMKLPSLVYGFGFWALGFWVLGLGFGGLLYSVMYFLEASVGKCVALAAARHEYIERGNQMVKAEPESRLSFFNERAPVATCCVCFRPSAAETLRALD